MSFRKWLPAALLAVLAFLGATGTAVGAVYPASKKGERITARQVEGLIVATADAARTNGRISPRVATILPGRLLIRAESCTEGDNWAVFKAYRGKDGGTLCNKERQWRRTQTYGPQYFLRKMRTIRDRIFARSDVGRWKIGRIAMIRSDGKAAQLLFYPPRGGESPRAVRMLQIKGSKVRVHTWD
jgi:hypothetical protein